VNGGEWATAASMVGGFKYQIDMVLDRVDIFEDRPTVGKKD
jgi:hypothetical protein